ncbi:twin-arginine translocation signal domain-containing protein [Halosimplex halobium]|uniref:twin-arginine translocation signal domain-containing protein n=1 Tax=Halosimplex halobium TaxID=3396618 RepID=UPI003F556429
MTEKRSRRQLLKGGIAVATAGVAGCSSLGPVGNVASTATIQETSISGSALAVEFKEDHDVTKLNLIGPSGSLFRSTEVATGATSAELGLFDYRRGWHYTPGEHSLVAISDDEEVASKTFPLEPQLEITEVQPYSGGRPTPSNRANLLVTVENTGTGPTWVYYVGYEDALDRDANHIPTNDYAKTVPLQNLEKPESKEDVLLEPGVSSELLGTDSPFLLANEDHCDSYTVELSVLVLSGIGTNARERLRATLTGEQISANFASTCSEISVKPLKKPSENNE